MDISSIADQPVCFITWGVVVIDHVVDVVCADVSSAMAIGAVGANVATKVEGTVVVTVGMTVAGGLSILACLS